MENRQQIIDAIEGIRSEYAAIRKREEAFVNKRRDEIQKNCGDMGHVYAKSTYPSSFMDGRFCVFCHSAEKAAA